MKIALLPNLTRQNAAEVTKNICSFLENSNVEIMFEKKMKGVFSDRYAYLDDAQLFSSCDIVVAVGGDGSIIHAAKKAYKYSKAILGINAGGLAFMAGLEKHETEIGLFHNDDPFIVPELPVQLASSDINRIYL